MSVVRRLGQTALIVGLLSLAYVFVRAWPEGAPPFGDGSDVERSW